MPDNYEFTGQERRVNEASDAVGGGWSEERPHLMDYVLKLHIITGPNGMCMCGEDGITCTERLRKISHEIGDALLGAHMAAEAGVGVDLKPPPTEAKENDYPGIELIVPSPAPASGSGSDLIRAERERQIVAEGWDPEHDDHHCQGELIAAAVAYIEQLALGMPMTSRCNVPDWWPWEKAWWRPSNDPVRNLTKAGALIAAEIDRLNRERSRKQNAELRGDLWPSVN